MMAGSDVGGSGGAISYNATPTYHIDQIMKDEDGEDELSMPVVTSDVLQPQLHRPRAKKTLSSLSGSQQTPSNARTSEQPSLSPAGPSQSPSHMRLAVHIRSSPIKPFTPINTSASREPSTLPLGRTRGRPPGSGTPITRPPTPNALTSLGMKVEELSSTPGSEPKKRGRPKGWRRGMPYSTDPNSRYRRREVRRAEGQGQGQGPRQAQGKRQDKIQSQGQGQGQEPKRRGRPPRPLEPSVRERYLQSKPDYIVYKCEWGQSETPQHKEPSICPAELQNMDTLRRHVFLIHGDADPLICRYSKCKDHDPPLEFKTDEEFETHMEKKHFASYLWHLGEGYQNNGIWTLKHKSDGLPAYLFDKKGNQITPSIADQQLENDLQFKERKRRLKRLLYQQNENAPSEEEWTKQMLGIA
ncbi:hypothetical protein HD806DRAFT_333840 [Xylariaceae sp. AK1471]|nr:hypothetical protein HD806DRAFT_333840 [Xylariaceae sp. AK1471]